MPTNKNALTRIAILDELLSDRHHYYNLDDLTEKCNERLGKPVCRRLIEKDLVFIEGASFGANIERFSAAGKRCLRYVDPSFSIFTKKLSDDEKNLLQETLATLGQFDGLKNFEWLEDFKNRLEIEERRKIICFSNNPYLKNSNKLGQAFNFISNRVAVRLSYQTFSQNKPKSFDFFPYLLKQYNDRWYLIGAAAEDGKILTFALDRIIEIQPSDIQDFEDAPEDLEERFDDIIGVTLFDDCPLQTITFWVSDESKNYILTKPLHGSQKTISGDKETILRKQYPQLAGGMFFSIECKRNYELISVLTSFGDNLLVLSPDDIRNSIIERISNMSKMYHLINPPVL